MKALTDDIGLPELQPSSISQSISEGPDMQTHPSSLHQNAQSPQALSPRQQEAYVQSSRDQMSQRCIELGSNDVYDCLHLDSVHLSIDERIIMTAPRDGGMDSLEVKGELFLKITNAALCSLRIQTVHKEDPSIQFKVFFETFYIW